MRLVRTWIMNVMNAGYRVRVRIGRTASEHDSSRKIGKKFAPLV